MNAKPDGEGLDIDFRELFLVLGRERRLIFWITFLCFSAAIAFALIAPNIYRAETVLQMRDLEKEGMGSAAALASKLGGFADLAGISLGSSASQEVAIATLQSRQLVQKFIEDRDLLPKLFDDDWDETGKAWKSDDPSDHPTPWLAYEKPFRKKILRVSQDRKTGLVTVAIEWKDPTEAAQWATELVSRTNTLLREKAIERAEKNLTYLDQQLRQTSTVELQQSLFSVIESEQKKLMVAKVTDEYAFQIVDPAFVPEDHVRPARPLIVLMGLFGGGLVGCVLALLKPRLSSPPANG